jgi:hypothetical protein
MTPDETLLAVRLASAAGLKPPVHNPDAPIEHRPGVNRPEPHWRDLIQQVALRRRP